MCWAVAVGREIGKHGAALIDARFRVELAEHDLLARLMQSLVEEKLTAVRGVGRVDVRPAGEDIGKARDVGLRITTADTERVQFENFAGEILVQPLIAIDSGDRTGPHGARIVEVMQHRRMAFDSGEHVGKTPEHMGADRLALVGAGRGNVLVGRNAEVVRPEPDQPFDKADLGVDGRFVAGRRLVLKDQLRQRRLGRPRRCRRRHIARHHRRALRFGLFFSALRELRFGLLFGTEVANGARRSRA